MQTFTRGYPDVMYCHSLNQQRVSRYIQVSFHPGPTCQGPVGSAWWSLCSTGRTAWRSNHPTSMDDWISTMRKRQDYGKSMGNHRKMVVHWVLWCFYGIYLLVNLDKKTGKIHHVSWQNSRHFYGNFGSKQITFQPCIPGRSPGPWCTSFIHSRDEIWTSIPVFAQNVPSLAPKTNDWSS